MKNSENDKNNDIQRRERELEEREHAIRLRELEAELNQPPLHKTVKYEKPESSLKRLSRQMLRVGKYIAIVVALVIGIKVASQLTTVIIIGSVGFVVYKLFFEGDRTKS